MKPITKKHLLPLAAALCCTFTMAVTTACTSIDNPSIVVDNKEWKADESKDTSIRPGDDFFMYCNGSWWNSTVLDGATSLKKNFMGEIDDEMTKREDALTLPSKVKVLADAAKTDAATIQTQKDKLQSAIDRVNAITSKEEAWKLAAELYKEGYRTPFNLVTFSIKGKVAVIMSVYSVKDYAGFQSGTKQSLAWQLANNANLLANVRPLKAAVTRSFDGEKWPMLTTFFNTLGIPLDDVYTIDTNPDYISTGGAAQLLNSMLQFQSAGVDEWKEELKEVLEEDAVYFDSAAAAARTTSCEFAVQTFLDIYLRYELSRAFGQAYVTAEQIQLMTQYAEELRQTLRERIQQYDWMSEASKQNAIQKINNMTFNIGAPDEWFDEGVADLSQEATLLDDILALRGATFNLNRKLVGMPTKRASFHQIILMVPLTTVNSCYIASGNYMNILPAYMLHPNYNPDVNDAHNYANMMAWGHEIIHGFDTNGAKFDAQGDWGPLWANESDSQEFAKRAQQLIDYYSSIDIMPFETGLKNDGAFTVAENVADLGGFLLAYESYIKHLTKQGFKGQQLRLQKKRFYEAYGYFWGCKWTPAHATNNTLGNESDGVAKNEHSLPRERVNGVVTNTDDFYDLFDVKPTDKLYLAPEKRIRIW